MSGDIRVDLKRISEIAGMPITEEMLPTWRHRVAARILTDAVGHEHHAMSNAVCWICDVFDTGKTEGIEQERRQWEGKIKQLFGIEAKR